MMIIRLTDDPLCQARVARRARSELARPAFLAFRAFLAMGAKI